MQQDFASWYTGMSFQSDAEGLQRRWAAVLGAAKSPAKDSLALMARLAQLHPYDVPEILSWPIADGLPTYLSWVAGEVISSPCERKTV